MPFPQLSDDPLEQFCIVEAVMYRLQATDRIAQLDYEAQREREGAMEKARNEAQRLLEQRSLTETTA